MKIIQLTNKVLTLCCVLFLLTGTVLQAQDYQANGKPLTYGIRAGFSESVLTINNQPSTINRFSPVIGGYAQYSVLPWVAASVEVVYAQYGGNEINPLLLYSPTSSVFQNLAKTDLKIHCIELPISAKIGLPGFSGSIKPFLSIGASLTYNMQAYAKNYFIENNGTSFPFYYSSNDIVTSRIKATSFSFISGTGVEFYGGKFNYTIEIYYRVGLTDLNYASKTYVPDFRANAFGVKIGIGL